MTEKHTSGSGKHLTEQPGKEIIADMNFQYKRLWFFMLNSIVIYILTYFIVYILSEVICYFIAIGQEIPTQFYYFEIAYAESVQWDLVETFSVSVIGPLIVFFSGMIIFDNFFKFKKLSPYKKMFVAWLAINGINFFWGSVIAGSFTGIGVGYTTDMILYPDLFICVFLVLAAIGILAYIGYRTSEFFLTTSPSIYWLQRKNQTVYLIVTLLIPYIVGNVIIYLVKYPNHVPERPDQVAYDVIVNLSMIFLILPILFKRYGFDLTSKIPAKERTRTVQYQFLIIAILLVLLFRTIFS